MRSPVTALAGAVAVSAVLVGSVSAQRPTHGRLPFPPEDLGILESPDREDWQQPDRIMDALRIGDGSRVADLGAGGGWFTVQLARRVGQNGRVYAHDIQPQMLESIRIRVKNEGLTDRVETRLGTESDPGLIAPLDAVLIVDTYPQLTAPVALLKHVSTALAPKGRLGIVDFKRDGAGGPGPPLQDRVDPDDIRREAEQAGLQFLEELPLPYQYLLIFGRQDGRDAKPGRLTR
jgi:SAM-dependent methyltransferase